MQYHYDTGPYRIGKHEWRCVVIDSHYGRVTQYQWRKIGTNYWRRDEDWPRYNHNDGMYGGMPKSLVHLYNTHKPKIRAALGVKEPETFNMLL